MSEFELVKNDSTWYVERLKHKDNPFLDVWLRYGSYKRDEWIWKSRFHAARILFYDGCRIYDYLHSGIGNFYKIEEEDWYISWEDENRETMRVDTYTPVKEVNALFDEYKELATSLGKYDDSRYKSASNKQIMESCGFYQQRKGKNWVYDCIVNPMWRTVVEEHL